MSDLNINTVIIALSVIIFITFSLFNNKPKKSEKKVETRRYPIMLGMATGNPKYKVSQKDALKVALRAPECDGIKNILERVYSNSRITYRYMAIPDFTPEQNTDNDELFFPEDSFSVPIQQRMEKYKEVAIPLVVNVCEKAIAQAGVSKSDIHKLIVVSSTGFLGPSLDCALITELGLPRTTDRSLIGFMGCAAAMNGYRVAMDYSRNNPGKLALLVCVEISSVNTTFKDSVNDAIIHAIFADGAAACVISAELPENIPKGTLVIYDDHSHLMAGTEDGITLSINDDGISCKLSKYLPQYIAKNMGGYVDAFLSKHNFTRQDVEFWAIHPGGRRIIEEAQNGLGVTEEQAADSWAVLDQFGNMLSPSVMFVLDRVFQRHRAAIAKGEKGYKMGLAFSFSPGVGAEGIMLKQL
jgi:alpha-pyrone synthase